MTVSEMLDQLKQKFVYVAPLSLPSETKEGLTGPFLFNVIKQIDDASVSNMTLKIYVKDLNMPTEKVLFDGYNPFKEATAPQTTFTQEVQEYIKTLTQTGTFDYAKVEDTNEETERAFVRAYKIEIKAFSFNVFTETALIIYRQEDGTLTHKEATTS